MLYYQNFVTQKGDLTMKEERRAKFLVYHVRIRCLHSVIFVLLLVFFFLCYTYNYFRFCRVFFNVVKLTFIIRVTFSLTNFSKFNNEFGFSITKFNERLL